MVLEGEVEADQGHNLESGFYSCKFLLVSNLPPEKNEGCRPY